MPFTDRRLCYHVESEYHACIPTLGKLSTCLYDAMETVRDQLQVTKSGHRMRISGTSFVKYFFRFWNVACILTVCNLVTLSSAFKYLGHILVIYCFLCKQPSIFSVGTSENNNHTVQSGYGPDLYYFFVHGST